MPPGPRLEDSEDSQIGEKDGRESDENIADDSEMEEDSRSMAWTKTAYGWIRIGE
jgi:hypothetical protein